jgi:hypothetical protein
LIETIKGESLVSGRPPVAPPGPAKKRGPKPGTKRTKANARSAAEHRWNVTQQTDANFKEHCRTIPLDALLEEYAQMRKRYEAAGAILNDRVQKEKSEQVCEACGKDLTSIGWYNRQPVRDPETDIVRNVFSCSPSCFLKVGGIMKGSSAGPRVR